MIVTEGRKQRESKENESKPHSGRSRQNQGKKRKTVIDERREKREREEAKIMQREMESLWIVHRSAYLPIDCVVNVDDMIHE
jgi:hypothetical protein